jgi:tetratricopeptide (TPR) repeat protein
VGAKSDMQAFVWPEASNRTRRRVVPGSLALLIRFFVLAALLTFGGSMAWAQAGSPVSVTLAAPSETDGQIATAEEQIKKTPADYAGYQALGTAFLQKARETGDIDYYDRAEQALNKSLNLAPEDFRSADPLVQIALVCMGEHRFTDALDYSQRAIELGSGNLAAFAVYGDAETDMGEYDEAESAYDAVQGLGEATSPQLSLAYMLDSRKAYLRFLNGEPAKAIDLMKSAITAGLQTRVPRENVAWLYFELGERYFQQGDIADAELSYQAGINADPNHYRSLAGLAKVRAAQGRFDESVQLYKRSITVIPFPVYVAELGDVYKRMGKPAQAQEQYDLIETIAHLSKLEGVLANRDLALFYADHDIKLPEAEEFARKELEVRHDIYTWDALAWVLYKNGQTQEAADAMNKAVRLHTNDPLLLFHAGMIDHAIGRDNDAEQFLSRALNANPHFHVFFADVARATLDAIASSGNPVLRSSNAVN